MPRRARSVGPRWTRKRLVDTLAACYGRSPRGGVACRRGRRGLRGDAADGAAVDARHQSAERAHPRTPLGTADVRRRTGRGPPTPASRLRVRGDRADRAAQGRGILPAWRDRGWLEPHVVAVIAVRARPWRQVVVTNGTARSLEDLRRRGDILDITTVATRFHAVVLASEVMALVRPWRIHPSKARLAQGRSQVFAHDAPSVDLSVLAVSHDLDESGPGRRQKRASRMATRMQAAVTGGHGLGASALGRVALSDNRGRTEKGRSRWTIRHRVG